MSDRQRTFGQFETPPDVADLLLSLCVRRASDRVLDPSCGSGPLLEQAARWQRWLANGAHIESGQLWGVELDPSAAAAARRRVPQAHILQQNFFTMGPGAPFDAIVGNPPYTRAEWFDRLQQAAATQPALFDSELKVEEKRKGALIPERLWQKHLSRRAGLHAYFILHGARFLREGGRFGFVLPNNWLDVGYGEGLKQFLLQHFKLIALVESTAERWFADARVNTCLLIMEKCDDADARAAQLVRFVQLRRPLAQLVPYGSQHLDRFSAVERLTSRLLPAQDSTSAARRVRVMAQGALRAGEKWGLYWRAPAAYRQARRQAARRGLAPLKAWATVQRGFTTGANAFFYLDQQTIERWQIEPRFRRPLLKSLRHIQCLSAEAPTACEVLTVLAGDSLAGTGAGAYVAWGEGQGINERSTCRARQPWFALQPQEPAQLLLAKGIWERHLAPVLKTPLLVDQQLYRLAPRAGIPLQLAAALLNSSWAALQMELQGRVNFGEGVLWLATYEAGNLLLPDPRRLAATEKATLIDRFESLSSRPLYADPALELAQADRKALDEAVFELAGLSPTEGIIIQEALLERVAARHAHMGE